MSRNVEKTHRLAPSDCLYTERFHSHTRSFQTHVVDIYPHFKTRHHALSPRHAGQSCGHREDTPTVTVKHRERSLVKGVRVIWVTSERGDVDEKSPRLVYQQQNEHREILRPQQRVREKSECSR